MSGCYKQPNFDKIRRTIWKIKLRKRLKRLQNINVLKSRILKLRINSYSESICNPNLLRRAENPHTK